MAIGSSLVFGGLLVRGVGRIHEERLSLLRKVAVSTLAGSGAGILTGVLYSMIGGYFRYPMGFWVVISGAAIYSVIGLFAGIFALAMTTKIRRVH